MKDIPKSIFYPIASLIILLLGNGLFMTYITIRLKMDNFSNEVIGIVSSAYYFGMFIGSIQAFRIIKRLGHIKAYIFFVSILSVVTMLQGFYINAWSWSVLRAFNGAMMAGLFIAIESWLLVKSTPKVRGKILSIYMIALYGAQSLGQFLLNVSNPKSLIPYAIVVSLTLLSILPIKIMNEESHNSEEHNYLSFFKLLKISPLGVVGCFLSGILLGTVYSINPLYAQEIGLSLKGVALFMSLTIFGGLSLQWPIGHLSDFIDRRKVILVMGILTVVVSVLIAALNNFSINLLFALIFVFGGLSFTLYPLCISHTCDYLDSKDFVAATGGLMLAYGIGAIIGPLLAPIAIQFLGAKGLFIYFAAIGTVLTVYAFLRIIKLPPIPKDEKLPFNTLPRTTPSVGELDPRSKERK